jgi:hypothetical protein
MSDALRRLTRDRAGGRCEYCQLPDSLPPLESFHLEHIVARQLTPIGRTTVSLLQMNAERRIERRAELVKRGLFQI